LASEPQISTISFRTAARKAVLAVRFADGTNASLPLDLFPSLAAARPAQRKNWRLIGDGVGVHWPDLDLDLSAVGLRAGMPDMTTAARSRLSPRNALIAALASRSSPLSAHEIAIVLAGNLKKETIRAAIAKLKATGILDTSKASPARRPTARRRSVA